MNQKLCDEAGAALREMVKRFEWGTDGLSDSHPQVQAMKRAWGVLAKIDAANEAERLRAEKDPMHFHHDGCPSCIADDLAREGK